MGAARLLAAEPEWTARATCRVERIPTAVFFPQGTQTEFLRAVAVAVCVRCPVRVECARHADATDEEYGVWGGVERETASMARARRGRGGA